MGRLIRKTNVRMNGKEKRKDSPRGEDGFTLVEILIALTVLVVGLLGILSLFPYSMNNIQDSTEFTKASTIASSFHQALLTGVHNAGTRERVVTIHHSGIFNQGDGIREKYTFPLPEDPLANQEEEQNGENQQNNATQRRNIPPQSVWIPCPGGHPLCPEIPEETAGKNIKWGGGGTGRGDSGVYRWQFGEKTTGSTSQTANNLEDLIEDIRENFDPTISLDQYSVAIVIRNRGYYPENLYEVLIRVYRSFTPDADVLIPRTVGGENHKDLIREYRAMISR